MRKHNLLLITALIFATQTPLAAKRSFLGRLKRSVTKRLEEAVKGPKSPETSTESLANLKQAELFIKNLSESLVNETDATVIASKERELKLYLSTLIASLLKEQHTEQIKTKIDQMIIELRTLQKVIELIKKS